MTAIDAMPAAGLWALFLVFAAVTYLLRASFVALFSYVDVPESVDRHLDLVGPAVLSAVALPPLVYRGGSYHLSPTDPFLLAGLAGAVVAWRTESLVGTMAVGLLAYALAALAFLP